MARRKKILGAAIVGIVALVVYGLTVAPGLTWAHDGADGGDLAVAVANLGIPHPPGYPTYVLLGKLTTALLPLGDIAYRLNLLSVASATLAVIAVYLCLVCWPIVAQKGQSYKHMLVASGSAALMIAFSPTFWSQAIITEVYALNAAFVAVILLLLFRILSRASETKTVLPWLGLILGIGLGNHQTLVLLIPSIVVLLWRRRHDLHLEWKVVAKASLATAAGLAVYLYLPLRAAARPVPNWGNPVTVERLLWMVSGSAYRHYLFGLPLSYVPARLSAWASGLLAQYGVWGVILGLTGLWQLAENEGDRALAEGMLFFLYSIYALGYDTADSYVYLIPAYLVFALWIGRGIAYLLILALEQRKRWGSLPVLALVVTLLLPLVPLGLNYASLDLSSDMEAARYGAGVVGQVPPGSIVISATDAHTFSLWYAQEVSDPRTDIVMIDRDLLQYPWYVENLRDRYPHLSLRWDTSDPSPLVDGLIDAWCEEGPVFLTDPDERARAEYQLVTEGELYRVLSLAEP
ncbi:MAG: DUF2723 domain-containing protein [Chloroflexota bacterium]